MSKASPAVTFQCGLTPSDPEETPVLIVGQVAHLNALSWQDIRCKLEPRVTEEAWKRGLWAVSSPAGEAATLWPRGATLASLPARGSRHDAPARPHALARHAKLACSCVVLVCRKAELLASCVAVARAVPLFQLKAERDERKDVSVQIILLPADADNNTDSDDEDIGELDPYLTDTNISSEELSIIQATADATRMAARIADTPANLMNVDQFIEEAIAVAKELDIPEPTIIRGEELKERGMGGIYGVGRAAACPPALVTLSYLVPGASETVAWVGKGIVYDTGGLSIKSRTAMVGMKGDCAGAAAVLGAFSAVVRARPTVSLHAVLCLAENAVGPLASRPDDIHQLYSGRYVEINNTDAEGRLVLSDGVVWASRDLKANVIVDMATLTGAQGVATGKYHAAAVSNSGRLERRGVRAGRRAGELLHALPFAPGLHYGELASTLADCKNSVADRNNAQPSCAALFILSHLGFDFPGQWLHIDMAAPAHCGERATGYGVALLAVLFGAHTRSALLRALAPRT